MFGRFGWAEILVIVVLVVILFGSAKIPGMMKNLADGINIFKKELESEPKQEAPAAKPVAKKSVAKKKKPAKKAATKKSVKK